MKQIILLLAILPLLGIAGRAQVLFSNFGPGYSYNTSDAWYTGGSSSGCAQVTAAKFTPPESALFEDAKLPIALTAGTNQVAVYLETDNAGDPGTLIEGPINVTGLTGPPGSVITAPSTLHPLLQGGTPYWLVVTSSNADTCSYWYFNSTGDMNDGTNLAFHPGSSSLSGTWVNGGSSTIRPAFEIDGSPTVFQVRYVSNLDIGDSIINISNDGESENGTLFAPGGNLCVGVYSFDPSEELLSCCTCTVSPNGLVSLSARKINSTNLTPEVPTSLVIKLIATSCDSGALAGGMHAWGTTIHALPTTPVSFGLTETPFSTATLSPTELAHINEFCQFNQANGTGFGICSGCNAGALGAAASQ